MSSTCFTSWADEAEIERKENNKVIPSSFETIKYDEKTVTSYHVNQNGKLEKITQIYKIESRQVPKSVINRKLWRKFGDSARDLLGPNSNNTFYGDEVQMQFVDAKNDFSLSENAIKLKIQSRNFMKCRTCQGNHWTLSCPFKDVSNFVIQATHSDSTHSTQIDELELKTLACDKYITPNLRDKINLVRKNDGIKYQDISAIRIDNLSLNTTERDLEELVRPFGPTSKISLPKDSTGTSKGFAFIHYKSRIDAQAAIKALNKHGYDHLILDVDWSKPIVPRNFD